MSIFAVTGGAGFIGSNLAKRLVEEGSSSVRVIDNLSTGKKENLDPVLGSIEFKLGDLRDIDFLKKQFRDVDVVFHEAALTSVEWSIMDPIATNESNVDGTLNVLIAARDSNVRRVVYASSSSVYGDSPTLPKHEEMPVDPASPYALSKYTGEIYCHLFKELYGIETICLRYFNVFGPRQDATSHYAAVIPLFISAILKDDPITVYGDGEQTRDFIYVQNVVSANLLAAFTSEGVGETFNIACGNRISVNQLAEHLMEILGKQVPINHVESRHGEVKHSLADISKAETYLGYIPEVDVLEGLRRSAEWAKS